MRVLVTGATGYIGQRAALRFAEQGWDVHALTRSTSTWPELLRGRVSRHDLAPDVASLTSGLTAIQPDCVVHIAAAVIGSHRADQADTLIESNIAWPTRLLEAMRASGCRNLVNTGSFWQHYDQADYWPVDLYAATKQAFEAVLRHYTDQQGLSAVTLKLFDTYGAEDIRRKIVSLLADTASSGERLAMSAGEQILDLTHVDDVASAYVAAVRHIVAAPARTDERYFVSGERLKLKDLVALVGELAGAPLNVDLGARPYRVREIMEPPPPGKPIPGWVRRLSVERHLRSMFGCA